MANKYTTKKEAEQYFKEYYLPNIPKNDKVAIRTEWNNYTDALCKDGEITETKYNNWTQPNFCK